MCIASYEKVTNTILNIMFITFIITVSNATKYCDLIPYWHTITFLLWSTENKTELSGQHEKNYVWQK